MAVFGKLAYDEGATVGTLLAVRFALAAALFWALLAAGAAGALRALRRRDVALGLAPRRVRLRAPGRAATSPRSSGSTPRCCRCCSTRSRRSSPSRRSRSAASGSTRGGWSRSALALRRAGARGGRAPAPARSTRSARRSGSRAAVVYSAYILVSERHRRRGCGRASCRRSSAPARRSSLTRRRRRCSGELRPGALTAAGWGWLACLAVVSTVGAISLFFAGLRRVGPTTASILATVEPLVTVVLAFLVFGETLGAVQLAGGALVLAAVVILCVRIEMAKREVTA